MKRQGIGAKPWPPGAGVCCWSCSGDGLFRLVNHSPQLRYQTRNNHSAPPPTGQSHGNHTAVPPPVSHMVIIPHLHLPVSHITIIPLLHLLVSHMVIYRSSLPVMTYNGHTATPLWICHMTVTLQPHYSCQSNDSYTAPHYSGQSYDSRTAGRLVISYMTDSVVLPRDPSISHMKVMRQSYNSPITVQLRVQLDTTLKNLTYSYIHISFPSTALPVTCTTHTTLESAPINFPL